MTELSGPPRAYTATPPARANSTSCVAQGAAARFIAVSSASILRADRHWASVPEVQVPIPPWDGTIRVAATGDLHAGAGETDRVAEAFREIEDRADLVLLAGDLTQRGQLDNLTSSPRRLPRRRGSRGGGAREPRLAVRTETDDLARDASVTQASSSSSAGTPSFRSPASASGIAGVKGFVGGFGNEWANFGEPLFRAAYAETTADVEGLDAALRAIASCAIRIALLHYAPVAATLGRRAGAAVARARLGAASQARCDSTGLASSCTATRIAARSTATSTASRSTTSRRT